MTDVAYSPVEGGVGGDSAPPPVKPPWLRAASLSGVVLAHAGVAFLLLKLAVPAITSLESISMELVPQGDFVESQEVTAAEEEPPPPEEIEQPDLAIPPPQVMAPDAPVLPQQKEVVEQKKRRSSNASARSITTRSVRRRRAGQSALQRASRSPTACRRPPIRRCWRRRSAVTCPARPPSAKARPIARSM